ncbi:MAG: LamG domain-containing protein [Bacteroidetes bacterium]|nr:LamG domain-containing protein [Bacteroidota bacterium]
MRTLFGQLVENSGGFMQGKMGIMVIVLAGLVFSCSDNSTDGGAKNDPGTQPADLPSSGLVAWYPLDGNAVDGSSNKNDGTIGGGSPAAAPNRKGTAGKATVFNGTTDYFTIPTSSSLESPDTALTLAVWVNTNALASIWASPLAKSNTSAEALYRIGYSPYSAYGVFNGMTLTFSGTIEIKSWVFLAITYSKAFGKMVFYRNGEKFGEVAGNITPGTDKKGNLEIGRDTPYATEYFNGSIDDLRIYNRALTPEEIKKLYGE